MEGELKGEFVVIVGELEGLETGELEGEFVGEMKGLVEGEPDGGWEGLELGGLLGLKVGAWDGKEGDKDGEYVVGWEGELEGKL